MPKDIRIKFSNAVKIDDEKTQWDILGMALSGLSIKEDVNVHIAGEESTVH